MVPTAINIQEIMTVQHALGTSGRVQQQGLLGVLCERWPCTALHWFQLVLASCSWSEPVLAGPSQFQAVLAVPGSPNES